MYNKGDRYIVEMIANNLMHASLFLVQMENMVMVVINNNLIVVGSYGEYRRLTTDTRYTLLVYRPYLLVV
jgi:hypothetical protein